MNGSMAVMPDSPEDSSEVYTSSRLNIKDKATAYSTICEVLEASSSVSAEVFAKLEALEACIRDAVDIDADTIRDSEQISLLRERLGHMLPKSNIDSHHTTVHKPEDTTDDCEQVAKEFEIKTPQYESLADMIEAVYMAKWNELKITPMLAMKALKSSMTDAEYAWSWHCNFAMPIADGTGCSHAAANEVAARLMKHIFNVDTTVGVLAKRYTDCTMPRLTGTVAHADRELKLAGFGVSDSDDAWFSKAVYDNVMQLVQTLASQHHTGWSVHQILNIFDRVARYKLLTPLTGEDGEWNLLGKEWQNLRLSSVFKGITDNGEVYCYDIDNATIMTTPSGSRWRKGGTGRQEITFPYYQASPKFVNVDEDDNIIDNVVPNAYRIPKGFRDSEAYTKPLTEWFAGFGAENISICVDSTLYWRVCVEYDFEGIHYKLDAALCDILVKPDNPRGGLVSVVQNYAPVEVDLSAAPAKPTFVVTEACQVELAEWMHTHLSATEVEFCEWGDNGAIEMLYRTEEDAEGVSVAIRVGDTLSVLGAPDGIELTVTPGSDSLEDLDDLLIDSVADFNVSFLSVVGGELNLGETFECEPLEHWFDSFGFKLVSIARGVEDVGGTYVPTHRGGEAYLITATSKTGVVNKYYCRVGDLLSFHNGMVGIHLYKDDEGEDDV
jgi:hypothetical protein